MKYIRSLDVTRTPFCWVVLGVFFLRADSCVTAIDRILTFPLDTNISIFKEEEIKKKEGRSARWSPQFNWRLTSQVVLMVKGPPGSAGEGEAERGVPSRGQKDPLEKEMAAHSSILAWRIP